MFSSCKLRAAKGQLLQSTKMDPKVTCSVVYIEEWYSSTYSYFVVQVLHTCHCKNDGMVTFGLVTTILALSALYITERGNRASSNGERRASRVENWTGSRHVTSSAVTQRIDSLVLCQSTSKSGSISGRLSSRTAPQPIINRCHFQMGRVRGCVFLIWFSKSLQVWSDYLGLA